MGPELSLLRRFVVDFMNRGDALICAQIMSPDYELMIGRQRICGRDDNYLPAVESQFDQFPGMVFTVHQVAASHGRAAISFTEHGASGGPGGPVASWSGIALFEVVGGVLTRCRAQEDYLARRRQLKSGVADPVAPPAAAPWDTVLSTNNPEAEAVVREWLVGPSAASDPLINYDDEAVSGLQRLHLEVLTTDVLDLFSAASEVAYSAVHSLKYHGGPDGPKPADMVIECASAGIVTVKDGQVVSGRVIRERQGLLRSLNFAQDRVHSAASVEW